MSELANLQEQIKKFCNDRDWQQFHKFKDLAISLSLEASEVLEHFQWKSDEEINKHINEKSNKIADELADVLYWTLYISDKAGIDLSAAFAAKMKKNEIKYPIEKAKGSHRKYTEI
ncbi:nucleotide pyrophosphohydrolase [Candidatus Saccharibacteria bacterium]|jgi:dCTP diphosphatase|nr:nucleotide pyrophosphohydrolase [Candidatus Saccharibacteria bacterium]